MTGDPHFCDHRRTRRQLITALGLAAAVGARAKQAVAARAKEAGPAKLTQRAAAYQSTPNGLFSCAACTFFIKPGGCRVVSGEISPRGWCKLFDLAD